MRVSQVPVPSIAVDWTRAVHAPNYSDTADEDESGAPPIDSNALGMCCSRCKYRLSCASTFFRRLPPYLSDSARFLRHQLRHLSWMQHGRSSSQHLPRLASLRSSVKQPSLLV